MKSYKHTPGPWGGGGGYSLPIVATVKGKPTQIGMAQPCGDRLTDDEVVGNALLMRAAPDLLAACERALAHFDGRKQRPRLDTEELRRAVDKAKTSSGPEASG